MPAKSQPMSRLISRPPVRFFSSSQWRGGFPGHGRVFGLGQEAHAAAGSPAAPLHATDHAVRSSILGGQLVWAERGPDQEPGPHQSHRE